jgi:hypothetical protein
MMTNLNRFQESIIETLNEIIIELNARSRQIAPDNVSDDVVH